jgi:alkyl hydroperoxide reductase subunit AhpF
VQVFGLRFNAGLVSGFSKLNRFIVILQKAERMTRNYNIVVIGSGPAGQSGAELAAFFGRRAVIVEKNKPGGVVTTTGALRQRRCVNLCWQ